MSILTPKTAKNLRESSKKDADKPAKKVERKSSAEKAKWANEGAPTTRDPERTAVVLRKEGEAKMVTIYPPVDLMTRVDIHLLKLGKGRQRSAWITEAIQEKLEREEDK